MLTPFVMQRIHLLSTSVSSAFFRVASLAFSMFLQVVIDW